MIKAVVIFLVFGAVCAETPMPLLQTPFAGSRIVKGENANEGEFPYMISLRLDGKQHICGGAILTKNWALTAAHCCAVGRPSSFVIVAGTIYSDRGGSSHPAEKLIKHIQYSPHLTWRNDICLIRVSKPFQFSDKVNQITLPPQGWQLNHDDKLTMSGWGYTTPNHPQVIPSRMQKSTGFTYVDNSTCIKDTGINWYEGYLCARGAFRGQGVCQGDSGGPIVKNGVQVGICSFCTLPCGNGKPDFFARVPLYVNWIKEQLGSEAGELKLLE